MMEMKVSAWSEWKETWKEEAKAPVYRAREWVGAEVLSELGMLSACTLRARSQNRVFLDGLEWTVIGEPC